MPGAPEAAVSALTIATGGGWLWQGAPWQPVRPLYAVLGDPIQHSQSPAMQTAGIQEREIQADYLPARIQSGQLDQLKREPERYGLLGFNVTSPLKAEAATLCDGKTDAAREAEAVNTVQVKDGLWLGHNTDSGGVGAVLTQVWPEAEPPLHATLLGAGGAARAALCALRQWGVPSITIINRSAAKRQLFGEWLARTVGEEEDLIQILPMSAAGSARVPTSGVWICCLPGDVDIIPFLPDVSGLEPCVLIDLRYGAQLPDYDAPLGFRRVDGKPVLLMQGGLSFAWWFGLPVPWQAMRSALAD